MKNSMDKTYEVYVECMNCGDRGVYSFDFGTLIEKSSVECEECRCKHQFMVIEAINIKKVK